MVVAYAVQNRAGNNGTHLNENFIIITQTILLIKSNKYYYIISALGSQTASVTKNLLTDASIWMEKLEQEKYAMLVCYW